MKKPLKIALYTLLALVLAALAYVIYVFAAYYRVEDYQSLDVVRTTCESPVPMAVSYTHLTLPTTPYV